MDDAALGAAVRALRQRRGWRQADLAARAGVSASLIGLLESSGAERVSVRALRRIARALDLRLGWDAGSRSQELARLRDADHARLGELLARRLEAFGWVLVAEASFNHYGERGRIDILAFNPNTNALLVVELKTVVVDVQATLGGLSVKSRVAPFVARGFGWRSSNVVPGLVIADTTTNRRRITEHDRLFARLGLRGRSALHWLQQPVGRPDGLLIALKAPNPNPVDARRAGRQRVRQRPAPARSTATNSSSSNGHGPA